MSEHNQVNSQGMPCVEEGENQINKEGLPEESYKTKMVQEDMEKLM